MYTLHHSENSNRYFNLPQGFPRKPRICEFTLEANLVIFVFPVRHELAASVDYFCELRLSSKTGSLSIFCPHQLISHISER